MSGDDRTDETENRIDTETTVERREVLSGLGGGLTATVGTTLVDDGEMGMIDRVRWKIETARLSWKYGDFTELGDDPAEVVETMDDAQRRELAAVGRRLYRLGGECGPEGSEIHGGPYNDCCAVHDACCSGQSTTECIGNIKCWGVFAVCATGRM